MSYRTDTQYPRRVIVDDTDPRIQYVGDWTLDVGSFDNLSIFGPPYNHTLHGTQQNGASFLFEFEGEFVQARGAFDNRKTPLARQPLQFAQWFCQVDGHNMSYYETPEVQVKTHVVLCEQEALTLGQKHILNLTVINPDTQMLWVDEIEYQPVDGANLQNEVLKVDSSDPSVTYRNSSGEWDTFMDICNFTSLTGSIAELSFTGTQVALYGVHTGPNQEQSHASYHIDNSKETPFDTPEISTVKDGVNLNQLIFVTPKLELDSHKMVIRFEGQQTSTQALYIDYFYVTTGENTTQLNTGGNEIPNAEFGQSKTPPGPIIGGVLGGVVGLLLVVGIILLALRRQRKGRSGRPGSFDHEIIFASPDIFFPSSTSNQGITSEPLMISKFDGSPPFTPYSVTEMSVLSNGSWKDIKTAQRNTVAGRVVEMRHQDSGIRYSQQPTVVDIPPNYSVQ
ncbi:hypothetical protein VNI00_010261 [Paramarasmius palmivorus]|uniref:Transmembrane protein n=1 Tax=Paramarasmius palmivorus TaxID=297713 RepID=A0AAW0CMD2_9AGAR